MAGLEGLDVGQLRQRGAHHVLAFGEHAAMALGHLETGAPSAGAVHLPGHDINGDAVARGIAHLVQQGIHFVRRQHDQQQAVVHRVEVEDLAVARGDDGADAELLQAPHRVLAAGAATEVGTGHQDAGVAPRGLVQHETGARRAGLVEAQVVQQATVQAGLVDDAQELLGHDLVGVQIAVG